MPGWGNVAIGCSALPTAPIATRQATDLYFLQVWLTEISLALGLPALIVDNDRQSYHIIALDAFMHDLPTRQKHAKRD